MITNLHVFKCFCSNINDYIVKSLKNIDCRNLYDSLQWKSKSSMFDFEGVITQQPRCVFLFVITQHTVSIKHFKMKEFHILALDG